MNHKILIIVLGLALSLVPKIGFAAFALSTATYEVPVPNHLKKYAHFAMSSPVVQKANGKTMIHYKLPAELVGPSHPGITMYSDDYSNDRFEFESEFGKAICEKKGIIHCNVKYQNIAVDFDEVRRHLAQHSKSRVEFEARFQVAAMFSRDPGGILKYHLQTK